MADYFRFTLNVDRSAVSDYSPRKSREAYVLELTPDESMPALQVEAAAAGTTLTTTHLSSGSALLVSLPSTASANVTLQFDTAGSANIDVVLTPGDFFFCTDWLPASNILLTAASGNEVCDVWITGT